MSIIVVYCLMLFCLPLGGVVSQEVTSLTPASMGLGFGLVHPENNMFTWLDYLGPNFVRVFFHPFVYSSEPEFNTQNWREFVSNSWRDGKYGNQFGISFAGQDVVDADSYFAAVDDFRSRVRNAPVGMGIAEFLETNHKEVNWHELLRRMTESASGITLMQQGIPEDYVRKLLERNIGIMAVWDWDCTELEFYSTDPASPDYYRERFEDYRVMYIGGAWMAEHGITDIELYNEPDKDSCIDRTRWNSDAKIKSQALQDAFADFSSKSGNDIKPYIIAPSTAASFPVNFAGDIIKDINLTFLAQEPDANWRSFDAYAFHAYGSLPSGCTTISPISCPPSSGHKLRTKFDNAKDNLDIRGYGDMDIHISEFNCYTYKTAEQLAGLHVMDEPSTSACVAAQIGSLYVREKITKSISLHKIAQNRVTSVASKVGKNGVLYGDTINPPFYVSGSSKSAEAYRMILKKSLMGSGSNKKGGKDVFKVLSRTHSFTSVNDIVMAWALKNDKSVSIFFVNQGWLNEDVEVDISPYGTMPNSTIVVTSVGNNEDMTSTLHGEVSGTIPVGTNALITFNVPPNTVQEAQIPLVPNIQRFEDAEAAVALSPSSTSTHGQGFRITSDSGEPSVMVIKIDDYSPQRSVIYTVLQLHVKAESTNTGPEIVTVFGYKKSDWNENDLSWTNFGMLRKYEGLEKVKDNIIDWDDDELVIVGHVTIPPASSIKAQGTFVRIDITPFVQSGIRTFALARMIRYDETGSGESTLPQDKPQGIYYISSRRDTNESLRPRVMRILENPNGPSIPFDPVSPMPPPSPPPPPPRPCSYQGNYMIQAVTCDNRYLAHSLISKYRSVKLRSWRQAKNPRRIWKIKSETKEGEPTTLFASGRRTKYSYLAGTWRPSLGEKDELIRVYPIDRSDCSLVQVVSHNRIVKGKKAFLGTKTDCSGLQWAYSRVANGNKRYTFRLKTV